MNDRKMLELAARAAGVKCDELGPYKEVQVSHYSNYCENWETEHHRWEPLDDDGDALRLALKLGMDIRDDGVLVRNGQRSCGTDNYVHIPYDQYQKDTLAATRRAIVRAAAEIGRAMG